MFETPNFRVLYLSPFSFSFIIWFESPTTNGKKLIKMYSGIHPIKVRLNKLTAIGSIGPGAVKLTIYALTSALRFRIVVARK